jgi:hypothetical protein
VKLALRGLGKPIALFGERLSDKRERLKLALAEKEQDPLFDVSAFLASVAGPGTASAQAAALASQQREAFHTEASDALILARRDVATLSFSRARERLVREADGAVAVPAPQPGQVRMDASQIGDRRPLSACSLSPLEDYLLVASWSETCKLWRTSDFARASTLLGHTDRVCDVQFRPVAGEALLACSGAADATVCVWRIDPEQDAQGPSLVLKGHAQRVSRVQVGCGALS